MSEQQCNCYGDLTFCVGDCPVCDCSHDDPEYLKLQVNRWYTIAQVQKRKQMQSLKTCEMYRESHSRVEHELGDARRKLLAFQYPDADQEQLDVLYGLTYGVTA